MQYLAGQLWGVQISDLESDLEILILKVEKIGSQDIVHITLCGEDNDGPLHMPFSKEALDFSVTELMAEHVSLPDFEDGYDIWRDAYERGEAGVYDISVEDVLSL